MRRTGPESLNQEQPIGKIVGRRKTTRTTLEDADQLLRTAWALRGTDKLVPGGLYRFETFEEADRWTWKTSPGSAEPSTKRKPGMS